MNATMTIGLSHSVVGFSDSDLSNIGEYCEYGLDHVHPFSGSTEPRPTGVRALH